MRFKMLILLSMFFIAFLAVTALSADWNNQQNLDAEQLLSGGEEEVLIPPAGQAATPQLSRKAQENKSSLDWTMPNTLGGGGKTPWASRDLAETSTGDVIEDTSSAAQETTSGEEATPAATLELPPSQAAATALPELGGSWSFTLNDSVQRDLAVTLFQKGNDLFGTGKIREGNNTLDVTVSGLVYENGTTELDVTTLSTISLYKLYLNLNGDMAAGDYEATSTGGDSWKGSVEGQKIA